MQIKRNKFPYCLLEEAIEVISHPCASGNLTCDELAGDLDVLLARHEDQNVTFGACQVHLYRLLDSCVNVVLDDVLAVHDVDGESSARNFEDWHIAKVHGKLVRVHRSGRNDEFEIVPTGDDLHTEIKVRRQIIKTYLVHETYEYLPTID